MYYLLLHKTQQENEQQEVCICQELPGTFPEQGNTWGGEKQQMTNTWVEQRKSRWKYCKTGSEVIV